MTGLNNKLTSGMCLLGFRQVCALYALIAFSFIFNQAGLHPSLYIVALIFPINTFLEQHI